MLRIQLGAMLLGIALAACIFMRAFTDAMKEQHGRSKIQ